MFRMQTQFLVTEVLSGIVFVSVCGPRLKYRAMRSTTTVFGVRNNGNKGKDAASLMHT